MTSQPPPRNPDDKDDFTATVDGAAAHAKRNWDRWDSYDPRDDEPSPGDL